jgi:hypothetical protein
MPLFHFVRPKKALRTKTNPPKKIRKGVQMAHEIELAGGSVALVDACDYARVSVIPWHALKDEQGEPRYARTSMKMESGRHRTVLMHRFILGMDGADIVDHINGNGLDNRRVNLRFASAKESARNTKPRGRTRLNGVRRYAHGYLATIAPNGMEIYLGTYDTPDEAAAVYNAAALIAYREFANLNPGGSAPDLLAEVLAGKRRHADRLIAEIAALTRGGN